MRVGRIIALVIGCLLIIPALAMLFSGATLGVAAIAERDDDGYFDANLELATESSAVTAEELDFIADPGSPGWLVDALDVDVRLRATSRSTSEPIFIGIANETDLDRFLAGVAHAEIRDVNDRQPTYRLRPGTNLATDPNEEDFWVASQSGVGTQELFWEARSGRWAVVVMNADGSPNVEADVNVAARSDIVVTLAFALLGVGAALAALAVALIVTGARSSGEQVMADPSSPARHTETSTGSAALPNEQAHPVVLTARLDPTLSRAKWLIKWFLAIPHFIVLAFLWIAFAVLTIVAGISILFTGTYPRRIFDFNVGVLRWSWRVQFYAWSGGIGTDHYPPFHLEAEPDDWAHLSINYPETLSRPLVLVKWLLALPHLLIVALIAGSSVRWPDAATTATFGGGLLGLLVIIAGLALLFTKTYPRALFDLIIGLNRWVYRVIAYVALMTDVYPPFRLDQGGTEPEPGPPTGPTAPPHDRTIDLTEPETTLVHEF